MKVFLIMRHVNSVNHVNGVNNVISIERDATSISDDIFTTRAPVVLIITSIKLHLWIDLYTI